MNDCEIGYTEVGNYCSPTSLCHSICDTCTVNNDTTKCSNCLSSLMSYQLPLPTSLAPGQCLFTLTNKAQYLFTIDKDTILGTSYLKNVTVNVTNILSTSGSSLTTMLLYSVNVIEMIGLSSNILTFELDGLPINKKIIVRARVYTECSSSLT